MGAHQNISVGDIARLFDLISEVSVREGRSPAEVVSRMARTLLEAEDRKNVDKAALVGLVARIKRIRAHRNQLIGSGLFRDPAWDMLLELFVAHERNEALTISSLCYASGVPLSTGTRQVQRLEDFGLVTRKDDGADQRRSLVKPTTKAVESVANLAMMLLDEIDDPRRPAGAGLPSSLS